jgi:hypothetical protein
MKEDESFGTVGLLKLYPQISENFQERIAFFSMLAMLT